MVRPLALQCLVLGLLVLLGLGILPRLSTRVHANALFHSGASSDPWGRPWVVMADCHRHHRGVIFSTGPDGLDDRCFTPDSGWSDSHTLSRQRIDDIFIVRPDDFRLLGAKLVVGVARIAAACLLALGSFCFPQRARRSWLVAGAWGLVLVALVVRGVGLLVEFRQVRDVLALIAPSALPVHVVAVATGLGALAIVLTGAVVSARARATTTASVAPAAS